MKKTTTISLTVCMMLLGGTLFAKGGLDKTFGNKGVVARDFNAGFDFAMATALQADGRILVTGYARFNGNSDFVLMRYNTDGSRDINFGDSGLVKTDFGKNELAFGLVIQPDGKIIVAGYTDAKTNNDYALARYKSNGQLDSSFGLYGMVIAEIGASDDFGQALTLQPDGKIVVAGYSGSSPKYDVSAARFLKNGIIDSTFSSDGRVITSVSPFADFASAVQVQANGKIVVAGRALNSTYDMIVLRYKADGSPDMGFGNGGTIVATPGSLDDMAYGLAIQPDQKILVAGTSNTGAYGDMAILRFDTSGQADLGFGSGGKRLLPVGTQNDVAYAVHVQSDGKILLGGYGKVGNEFYFALARVDEKGLQDNAFGEKGVQAFSMGTDAFMFSMAVQSDKKIVMAGVLAKDTDYDMLLGRFDPELLPSTGVLPLEGKITTVSVYPNPATHSVTVSAAFGNKGSLHIDLYDMQGKNIGTLYDGVVQVATAQFSLEFPEDVRAGVYMLSMHTPDGIVVKKITVANR